MFCKISFDGVFVGLNWRRMIKRWVCFVIIKSMVSFLMM